MRKIIALALCVAMSSAVLSGCTNNSEPFQEKSYTTDTKINEIDLDVQDREIDVSLSKDEQVHIQYSENNQEYYVISVSGNVLTMKSAVNKEWTDYIGVKTAAENRKISIQLPDAVLENLTLSTTNEDVTLSALTVTGSISISATEGDIIFETLHVGDTLSLYAKNGNISGKLAGSYDDFAIESSIKKGTSNLPDNKEDGEKYLRVSCNHGDVALAFVKE